MATGKIGEQAVVSNIVLESTLINNAMSCVVDELQFKDITECSTENWWCNALVRIALQVAEDTWHAATYRKVTKSEIFVYFLQLAKQVFVATQVTTRGYYKSNIAHNLSCNSIPLQWGWSWNSTEDRFKQDFHKSGRQREIPKTFLN